MKKLELYGKHPYNIIIDSPYIDHLMEYLQESFKGTHIGLISDTNVFPLYGSTLEKALSKKGYEVQAITFMAGEHSKSLTTVERITESLINKDFGKDDILIGLGGGLVGDITGFIASIFMRGISYIHIPTTWVSAIDSSVGGKTSINLNYLKNIIGVYWQPSLVLCDPSLFDTLDDAEKKKGIGEALKYAFVSDASLLEDIEKNNICHVIGRCMSIKKSLVEVDERDKGLRKLLSFGHTVGHGIESLSAFSITHGEAVALGMAIEVAGFYSIGLITEELAREIINIIKRYFPIHIDFSGDELCKAIIHDKKIHGSSITMPMPQSVGHTTLQKIDVQDLKRLIHKGVEILKSPEF